MVAELRAFCAERSVVGGLLPPQRELATRYGVSLAFTQAVVRQLQDEGLVQVSHGSGTSIVTRQFVEDEVFLYLQSEDEGYMQPLNEDPLYVGITDRLAELGAMMVAVPNREALRHIARDTVLRCRGLFGRLYDIRTERRLYPLLPFPTVAFGEHSDPESDDSVRWDDVSGGKTATQHLLSLGHERIGYVGFFDSGSPWQVDRAEGYTQAMKEAGQAHNVRIVGSHRAELHEVADHAAAAARLFTASTLPDAVVAVNDEAAIGFLAELDRLKVPLAAWPAIIGFDDRLTFRNQPISSMRMDVRELGRAAADILWGRAHGEMEGPPVVRSLPMLLVPRMTSQKGWAYRLHRLMGEFAGASGTVAEGTSADLHKAGPEPHVFLLDPGRLADTEPIQGGP